MKKRLVQRLLLVFLRSMTSKKSDCQQLCQCRFLSFPTLFFSIPWPKEKLTFQSFQETLILMLETSKTIVVSIDQTALKISLQGVSNLGNEGVGLDSFIVNKAYYCYDVIREGIKAYLISHGQSSKSFLRNGIPRYIHGRGIHLETTKFSRWYENVSYNWCFFQNRKSGIGNQSDHSYTMAFKWYTISELNTTYQFSHCEIIVVMPVIPQMYQKFDCTQYLAFKNYLFCFVCAFSQSPLT